MLDNVMMIEFENAQGAEMVALFDIRVESEESVRDYLKHHYPFITHRNIIVIYKEQFQNVFKVSE